ncbi:MAG: hypothetical protein MPEBLZ_00894 [Candidatus Methanoperedens nitroreducens]|uniref:Uncharacterized protein n=1 Tax=Candidatus Methanoperedens nitratireducens TaxID=1392998 RepID=A0A0P8ACL5_9EURY|nr:MAG: hypothetical protein MPEBLZ_00894 [Candidatus Methanoperedens sp. BLZ1]
MTVKERFCIAAGVRVPVKLTQEDAIVFIALFIMNISWKDYIFVIQKKSGQVIP